jgi:hypothetical protein
MHGLDYRRDYLESLKHAQIYFSSSEKIQGFVISMTISRHFTY